MKLDDFTKPIQNQTAKSLKNLQKFHFFYLCVCIMDLSSLPGLGPKRVRALNEAGYRSIVDLLYNVPRDWVDRTRITPIADCKPDAKVILIGHIARAGMIRGRKSRFTAYLDDGTGQMSLVFFRGANHWAKNLTVGSRWMAIGKVNDYRGLQIVHPELQHMEEETAFEGGIVPVYSISEVLRESRMEQKFFRNLYAQIFKMPNLSVPNGCPKELTEYMGLKPVLENLRRLHFPVSFGDAMQGRLQLKKLELLPFCLRMAKRRRSLALRGRERAIDQGAVMKARAELPYTLTDGQDKALAQILEGLHGKRQFHALLQGDVGSGKTAVALLAMLAVCGAHEQCAFMVPTDILARQHYVTLKPFFDAAGLRISLLLGATGTVERRSIVSELQMGLTHAVIGTHALFSKDVLFENLTFVIIDEQHRFGVNQREALLAKGNYPDLLVMSATPIPRSLAMTFYGDLTSIVMREKPPGRMPIKTRLVESEKREDMKSFILKEALGGNRCYWVVSRVEIDSEGGALSVGEVKEELQSFSPEWKMGAVHGQMDDGERDRVLAAFAAGTIHVIVATTVIEVGVNIPAANLMVIDQPERFGLAQLHQLRGRVGRGQAQAWCFLMCEQSNTARERLAGFAGTEDGFEIAEMDMRNRGAGNLEGSEQSGAWVFRWFDWIEDQNLIQKMLDLSEEILDNKPNFDLATREKIQTWYSELPEGNDDGIH